MADGVRLRSVWIFAALLAPPCQETNPDFDEPGSTDAAAESGASATSADGSATGSTGGADAGPTVTASGSGDADGTSSPPDTTGPATTTAGDADTGATTMPGCEDPMVICAGVCVDTTTNPDHCGNCNNKCNPAQESCVMGECVSG